jgi:hypothetical protein
MVGRVARNPWRTANIALCAGLAACPAPNYEDPDDTETRTDLLTFSQAYSAYDEKHLYQLAIGITQSALDRGVDPDSVRFAVDSGFISWWIETRVAPQPI